ncbi:hypothetical protein TorRG33x02_011410 [Trema orientale]|uniref:Uncharacterized protein n=1 Tax=Trema orientale TaxID=63057 RepID=A0A2P5FZ50_TREOI|nr:hypothetical protein TorRG33x02_011410 [Trema orientale]
MVWDELKRDKTEIDVDRDTTEELEVVGRVTIANTENSSFDGGTTMEILCSEISPSSDRSEKKRGSLNLLNPGFEPTEPSSLKWAQKPPYRTEPGKQVKQQRSSPSSSFCLIG